MNHGHKNTLDEAYRNTLFNADTPRHTICIKVDETNTQLDSLLNELGHDEWAYITAWNPGSKPLTEQENAKRQEQLGSELEACGHKLFSGEGVAADGSYREASVLVIGLPKDDAVRVGKHWGQNAIVYGRRGEAAQLVYI